MADLGDRGHPGPLESGPSRFDCGPARGSRADRPRGTAERRQVVAPPGAVGDPDQDGRLPVHYDAPGAGPDRIGGVLVQLVEIPGLIEGASEDRGGGRALLGVLRTADAIVYCCRADADPVDLEVVRAEIDLAGIDKPAFLAATRADEAEAAALERLATSFPDLEIVAVSILDEASLEAFRAATWRLTGLIRIRLRNNGETDPEPVALEPGATVADVADSVHHDLAASFSGARVWGGRRRGRDHPVSGSKPAIVSPTRIPSRRAHCEGRVRRALRRLSGTDAYGSIAKTETIQQERALS